MAEPPSIPSPLEGPGFDPMRLRRARRQRDELDEHMRAKDRAAAQQERARRQLASAAPRDVKLTLITLSGQTIVSSCNDIWCGIADVMGRVQANIEDASGTFMQSEGAAAEEDKGANGFRGVCPLTGASFLVTAFNTNITPFSDFAALQAGVDNSPLAIAAGTPVAVAIFARARIESRFIPVMTNLLHRRFPGLVCTVTAGSQGSAVSAQGDAGAEVAGQDSSMLTGTIRLFGQDMAGQLESIATMLSRCKVTILNLQVTTGSCDPNTQEFIEAPGGQLAENVLSVAAFDVAMFREDVLRREVAEVAPSVGYKVFSVILDSETLKSQELASYYLQRKTYIGQFVEGMGSQYRQTPAVGV